MKHGVEENFHVRVMVVRVHKPRERCAHGFELPRETSALDFKTQVHKINLN